MADESLYGSYSIIQAAIIFLLVVSGLRRLGPLLIASAGPWYGELRGTTIAGRI